MYSAYPRAFRMGGQEQDGTQPGYRGFLLLRQIPLGQARADFRSQPPENCDGILVASRIPGMDTITHF